MAYRDQLQRGDRQIFGDLRNEDLMEGAGSWKLCQMTKQAVQHQTDIMEQDLAGNIMPNGAIRDNHGNYYWTSLTPVKKTAKAIINGKPKDSKFMKLLSIPTVFHQASQQLRRIRTSCRIYIEIHFFKMNKIIRNMPVP